MRIFKNHQVKITSLEDYTHISYVNNVIRKFHKCYLENVLFSKMLVKVAYFVR